MVGSQFFQNLLDDKIFPLPREEEHLNFVIDRMTRFMHNNPLHIAETVVGGSYGKNTMVRERAEVDLVYVLTPQGINRAYDDLIAHLLDLALGEFNQNEVDENNFGCTIKYRGVCADVLIAQSFDSPLIFLNQEIETRMYKPYRIILQKDFAINRGTMYQNFVRLLKYWRDLGIETNWSPLTELKSFLLELLAAEIYDNSEHQSSFGELLREFFERIDDILTNQDQIYFDDNYDSEYATEFDFWTVNDPADPSYNVVPRNLNLTTFQNYVKCSKNRERREEWSRIFNYG